MTTPKTNLLLESLLRLYADNLEICEMFKQLDMSQLNRKFYDELSARISDNEVKEMQELLTSQRVADYYDALDGATFACTRDLSDMIDFVLCGNDNLKRLN